MPDTIFEFLRSLLCHLAEALMTLVGTGFRKLWRLFQRANRVPLPFLALAGAALLPSCVQWRLGENVLTATETYVGLDYRHPEGRQLYRHTAKDGTEHYYARVSEVRYRRMPDIVSLEFGAPKAEDASAVEPTGRSQLAELEVGASSPTPGCLYGIKRLVTKLPAGSVALPPADYRYNARAMIEAGKAEPGTGPGTARRAVAATLSHTIDPLLTFVSTTVLCLCEPPLALLAAPFQQQAEPQQPAAAQP